VPQTPLLAIGSNGSDIAGELDVEYPVPECVVTNTSEVSGDRWICDPAIQRGSALFNFSGWWDGRPAGADGGVGIKEGRLVLPATNRQNAHFLGCAVNMGPGGSFGFTHDISNLIDGDHAKRH
jgi:hypothetical protein